jgi:hypothetical protein
MMFDAVCIDKAVSRRRHAGSRLPRNLMPVADTGGVAGSTTGIMTETKLTLSAAVRFDQRPGTLLVRAAGLERFAER